MDGNAGEVLNEAMMVIAGAQAGAHHRVVKARKRLLAAQDEYENALLDADALGLSPTALARACGTSEAAIRLFVKRRKDKHA